MGQFLILTPSIDSYIIQITVIYNILLVFIFVSLFLLRKAQRLSNEFLLSPTLRWASFGTLTIMIIHCVNAMLNIINENFDPKPDTQIPWVSLLAPGIVIAAIGIRFLILTPHIDTPTELTPQITRERFSSKEAPSREEISYAPPIATHNVVYADVMIPPVPLTTTVGETPAEANLTPIPIFGIHI